MSAEATPSWHTAPPTPRRMKQEVVAELEDPLLEGLTAREWSVLWELGRDESAHVAFQGLRRRLDLHQEVLSRTLRRLERAGLVARDVRAYRLTEHGAAAVQSRRPSEPRRPVLSLVQALLPPHLLSEDVAARLTHRWFDGLRWYGRAETPDEVVLTWLDEATNAPVRLRLTAGRLALETEVPPGDLDRRLPAVRALLLSLAELYGTGADLGTFRSLARLPRFAE